MRIGVLKTCITALTLVGVGCARHDSASKSENEVADPNPILTPDDEPEDPEAKKTDKKGSERAKSDQTKERPFDQPKVDPLFADPILDSTLPRLELPSATGVFQSNGANADQLSTYTAYNSPIIAVQREKSSAAEQERLRREDEINANINDQYTSELAEYQAGERTNPPSRRRIRNSELASLAEADHLVSEARFSDSKVVVEQVGVAIDAYFDLLTARTTFRAGLATEIYLTSLQNLTAQLVASGESPSTIQASVDELLATNGAELSEAAAAESTSAKKALTAMGADPAAGSAYFADAVFPEPPTVTLPTPEILVQLAAEKSFELFALAADHEAAVSRVTREEWLLVEEQSNQHQAGEHSVAIEAAKVREIGLQIEHRSVAIAAEVTAELDEARALQQKYAELLTQRRSAETDYANLSAALANGEVSYRDLTDSITAVLESREALDLCTLAFFRHMFAIDRLTLSGVYSTLPYQWGIP